MIEFNGKKYYTTTNRYGVVHVHEVSRKDGKASDTVVSVQSNQSDADQYMKSIQRARDDAFYDNLHKERQELKCFRRKDNLEKFTRYFYNCYTEQFRPKACDRDQRRKLLSFLNNKRFGHWEEAVLNDNEIIEFFKKVNNIKE